MSSYFFIETQDPLQKGVAGTCYELASDLARNGNDVTLFLVENGVLPARDHAKVNLERLAEDGITLLADEFSLRERGIEPQRLRSSVQSAPISTVIDALADGAKAIWH